MKVIEVHNFTKKFRNLIAVNNISLKIEPGEIYGFLGLNGAGKTTTIRMLLGMIKPTQGTVLLFGKDISKNFNQWNNVGYLVETTHSYPNLTVRENLEVYFHLRKLTDNKLIDNVIERLKLSDYRNTKAKYLSLGNLQRLGLAKALMHEPKLLILDEPMNGLDPAGIIEIRQILVELSKRGTTIFISSHILNEIAKLATKIGIIHKGRLIKELESEQLEQQVLKKLIVETRDNMKAVELLKNNSIFSSINDEG
ncbi:ABC transporter ATP-binding protein [Thermosediminibacter litoriperuensis]|uniref:ABC-2 type transport system ATP-binding protein n=1 Tax=Thermosediminibacter litoriperuensis TaxID=291989 RepID=A0A5S5AYV6_9FIRM|nr:ABC transporter ATP-binding protein [Thermosediminibacter litoriperuensis]TYP58529.1 ABC-2 type transport system ATP-binding protein [Thermosediminibacter litoriperuensis]